MVANRLCEPDSKLGVWDRWLQKVYMPSCNTLKLYQMYEAMDLLHWNVAEVENAVFFHMANLFNLVVDVIFYDTTTASFSIDEADEDTETGAGFRKFGHTKNGTWSPQIVVVLAVTREGLPVRSWVFPGNTSDVDTVKKVRVDLRGWKLGRALFVADSGMNSNTNRDECSTTIIYSGQRQLKFPASVNYFSRPTTISPHSLLPREIIFVSDFYMLSSACPPGG
jgi:transposase